MTDEESRKAFEDELHHEYENFDRHIQNGCYVCPDVAEGWKGWQYAVRWMQSQQEWRSMEECFENGVDVMILMNTPPHTIRVIARRYTAGNGRKDWLLQSGAWISDISAIGWLPLPPLPKEGSK